MRNSKNTLQRTAAIVATLWPLWTCQAAEFAGGTGEPNAPYQIATAEQLISIGSDPNLLDKHFVLVNDIDLDPNLPGGRVFTRAVIAPHMGDALEFHGTPFSGSFDGRRHTISHLVATGVTADYLALFGKVTKQGVVKDLVIEDADVRGTVATCVALLAAFNEGRVICCSVSGQVAGWDTVGALIGMNGGDVLQCRAGGAVRGYMRAGGLAGATTFHGSRIVDCHAACSVTVTASFGDMAGGLVGQNWGWIANSSATGDVLSKGECWNMGGLVGLSFRGAIMDCHASGDVACGKEGSALGGLVGQIGYAMQTDARICNCYAAGDVSATGKSYALGGLAGYSAGYITRTYATGRVSGGPDSLNLGGLVGYRLFGRIEESFWDVEASGVSLSAGGTGLTTGQMQQQDSFSDWDFESTWMICEGRGHPRLQWEGIDCNEP